jgi:hypothetical protein
MKLAKAIRTGSGDNRMIRFAAKRIEKAGEKLTNGTATIHDISGLGSAATAPSNLAAAERGGLREPEIHEILSHIERTIAPFGDRAGTIFRLARESAASRLDYGQIPEPE